MSVIIVLSTNNYHCSQEYRCSRAEFRKKEERTAILDNPRRFEWCSQLGIRCSRKRRRADGPITLTIHMCGTKTHGDVCLCHCISS
ncbi:hypothetical protein GDO81_017891 [Engystomops pustulosus]|uniref:Uncharacterized protein n=1 Tax=Engystomops pustulosus TaxID=76066 RepID=A0AAV7A7W1_ENGPU|nr:hypothetical protein GDO81_017891 [Engystomops pustulosus]